MPSRVQTNSPTPRKELVNGGKLDSAKITGLIESEFSTDVAAVEIDLQRPKFSLEIKSVDQLNQEPRMDNGTLLSAKNQFSETRLD